MNPRKLIIAIALGDLLVRAGRALNPRNRHFVEGWISFIHALDELQCAQTLTWLDEGAAALIDELESCLEKVEGADGSWWSFTTSQGAGILRDAKYVWRAEVEASDRGFRLVRGDPAAPFCLQSAADGHSVVAEVEPEPIASLPERIRHALDGVVLTAVVARVARRCVLH